jgi:hypothetical protein
MPLTCIAVIALQPEPCNKFVTGYCGKKPSTAARQRLGTSCNRRTSNAL